ncbi:FHA domain-containing protein [Nocardia sp. NPDC052316]|uniref:FHA domain-containing protein n=1 Tax=Nocardia sp. NPDC052316 TaxID=3364329 RepID=UPI0037CAEBA6
MSRQIEVLPGHHLVASSGGVVVLVAHRDAGAVRADSVAARAMTALLGIVRQASSNEPRRSGRTVARLATNWLMGLENGDEEAVEFGVITPGDGGVAVFLHGGVTAVLSGVERSETLRGREAGFTVDRVVTPAPGVGVGLFVDEVGQVAERLPERGVFALGEGTAPGGGVVLWFGAGGLFTGAQGVPLRGVESQAGRHPQRGIEQHHEVAQPPGAEAQFGVQPRSGFKEPHGVQPPSAETPTGRQAPHGFEEQDEAGQRHGGSQRAELPEGEPPRAPDRWKRDDVADAGTEYYSTSPVSQEGEASGSAGGAREHGVAPQQVPDLRKPDDVADAGTEYYSTSPVSREAEASGPRGVQQQHSVAPQQVPDLRKRDDIADAATEQYGASAASRESDASPSSMTPPRTQIPIAEQSSGSSPSVSPARPHDGVSRPSTPRLPKPVGAEQADDVAHSGAQPGIVRPEPFGAPLVPDHPAARDADLEETVVPGEALAPRVRGGGVVAESRGVVVKGFKCARDHLNDPRVSFCAVCGIRMDQLTCILTDGIRPPLGLLLLDDGTSFVLDNDCVLGREPEHAEAVARGARPVRVEDHSGGMSRAHAEIRLIDWDVTVVDGGSTNGTHIRQPGHQDWTRAIPGHPVKLTPGAQIQLGGRVATFDSQHGQL